jgi:hypothetical protein
MDGLGITFSKCCCHWRSDAGALCASGLASNVGLGDQMKQVAVGEFAAPQNDGPRNFYSIVRKQVNEINRRLRIVGKSFGEGGAHRHLNLTG